jgi:ABC-2 type transport system ATP-binding protein
MWTVIKQLLAEGTTILLTTQYLEEADQLADNIVVIDGGKVIAEGSAKELKAKVGKDRLELTFANAKALSAAVKVLGDAVVDTNDKEFTATTVISDTNKDVKDVLETLSTAKINLESLAVHKPTLDDVFLSLTGKAKRTDAEERGEQ